MAEPALREVVTALRERTTRLNVLDREIEDKLHWVERRLRERAPRRVAFVPFEDIKLGWSGARGRWRFVLIDDHDDYVVPLLSSDRELRAAVLVSDALPALVHTLLPE